MPRHVDPISGKAYGTRDAAIEAVARNQRDQLRVLGVTASQLCFNHRNRLPLNTKFGKSVETGKPTAWSERAGAYERFADDAERAAYRARFLARMNARYGRDHLLDDTDRQRIMLASRRISGTHRFADGSERTYVGAEERALLEFLDSALGWPGRDVWSPAPRDVPWTDADGRIRNYIPDVWIESLNLFCEVKGEEHPGYRTRDAAVERAKDAAMAASGLRYAKVEDRDYTGLMDAMAEAASERDRAVQRLV